MCEKNTKFMSVPHVFCRFMEQLINIMSDSKFMTVNGQCELADCVRVGTDKHFHGNSPMNTGT